MKEIEGNIWDWVDKAVVVISTNGFVKKNGEAVMGRGVALQAQKMYPGIDQVLGSRLRKFGNIPHVICRQSLEGKEFPIIVSFPVKPDFVIVSEDKKNVLPRFQEARPGVKLPGWMAKAQYPLIQSSAHLLKNMADQEGWTKIVLPRVGCKNGLLKWKKVWEILSEILDDRFIVVNLKEVKP